VLGEEDAPAEDAAADALGAVDAPAEDAAADALGAVDAPPCEVGEDPQAARMVAMITSSETNDNVRLNIEILLCNVEHNHNA
jgi:hypothetical protein